MFVFNRSALAVLAPIALLMAAFFVVEGQHAAPVEGNLGPAVIVFD